MKRITTCFKVLAVMALFLCARMSYSQCVASFSYSLNTGGNVSFFSTSTPSGTNTVHYWTFGNSTTTMSANNGTATTNYPVNGVYTVTLVYANIAGASSCSAAVVQTINITNAGTASCNLVASAGSYSTSSPGQIVFTNSTTGTWAGTTYSWNFGDGSPSSTAFAPGHIYASTGTYTATLTANNNYTPACISTQTVLVTVTTACSLTPSFTYSVGAGGVVYFQSTSTGTSSGSSYNWNFGGGWGLALNSAAVTATYGISGNYVVTLNVYSPGCGTIPVSNTITVNTGTITPPPPCTLTAGFNYTQTSAGAYSFYNTSTGTGSTTSYSWSFGDGSGSGSNSPSHTYTANGTYVVLLTASNSSACVSYYTATLTISSIPSSTCVADASFTVVPSGTPQFWYAVPSSSAGVVYSLWTWGDGSSSTGLYPSHTYSAAGTYTICHKVVLACGDSATYCFSSYLSKGSGASDVIQINIVSAIPVATGIQSTAAETVAYSVSPNPANGHFSIRMSGLSSEKATISVYSLVGTLVYESGSDVSNGTLIKDIQLNEVPGGVYFIKVGDTVKTYTKKLIISK